MYLHLGNSVTVKAEDLIGIFDLDTVTVSKRTRDYLSLAEKKGQVTATGLELPKAFAVLAAGKGENRILLSQLSSVTLQKRWEENENFG